MLDANGNVVVPPTNLTDNTTWYQSSPTTYNAPRFLWPHIANVDGNRFVLTWLREHQEANGWVDDIYYAVLDSNGSVVKAITKLTNDTAGSDDGYFGPTVAYLSGNRALLAFQRAGTYGDIYFAILNGSGNVVQGMTNLSNDGTAVWDWGWPDAVQLSNGRIVVAWEVDTSPYSWTALHNVDQCLCAGH